MELESDGGGVDGGGEPWGWRRCEVDKVDVDTVEV